MAQNLEFGIIAETGGIMTQKEETKFRNPKEEILNNKYCSIKKKEWVNLLKKCSVYFKKWQWKKIASIKLYDDLYGLNGNDQSMDLLVAGNNNICTSNNTDNTIKIIQEDMEIILHHTRYSLQLRINSTRIIKLFQLYRSYILQHSYFLFIPNLPLFIPHLEFQKTQHQLVLPMTGFDTEIPEEDSDFVSQYQIGQYLNYDLVRKCKEELMSLSLPHHFYNEPVQREMYESNIFDLIDSIQYNGEIRCKCDVKLHSVIFETINITHNFYNQITFITELKVPNYKSICMTTIHQEPNRSVYAINMEIEKNKIETQWIEIKLKCDQELQYSFNIKIFMTLIESSLSSSTELVWDENMVQMTKICVDQHDIRKYVFTQTIIDVYHLYVSNDILSIIFDIYYPKYFDIYGGPFIYDTLQLTNNIQHLINKLPRIIKESLWSVPFYQLDEVFIITKNVAKHCNINGIGIQLSLDDGYEFDEEYLDKYDIDASNLTAIWLMDDAKPLFKLKQLHKELIEDGAAGNPTIDAKLLLDVDTPNDEFMLWITWDIDIFNKESMKVTEKNRFNPDCYETHGVHMNDEDVKIVRRIYGLRTINAERHYWCKQQLKRKRIGDMKHNKYIKRNRHRKYMYHRW